MSNIEWTDETWNPVVGCTKVSEGCRNCYAMGMAQRLASMADAAAERGEVPGAGVQAYTGVVKYKDGYALPQWNGRVVCRPDALGKPLGWRKPRMVFVNSMGDLFHESVPFEFIDRVFAVMAMCPQHTFQVLTKRPERMAEYFSLREWAEVIADMRALGQHGDDLARRFANAYAMNDVATNGNSQWGGATREKMPERWPLPNVWLGTSVEDQAAAELRIPHLLRCPAAVRFLSCEPLLGCVDLGRWLYPLVEGAKGEPEIVVRPRLDWVIVGGESGSDARPCHAGWIRSIVEQCRDAGVACFVKQLGRWPAVDPVPEGPIEHACCMRLDGTDYAISRGDRGTWGTGEKDVGWSQIDRVPGDVLVHRRLRDKKGGDPGEWPVDLRVREVPALCEGGVVKPPLRRRRRRHLPRRGRGRE